MFRRIVLSVWEISNFCQFIFACWSCDFYGVSVVNYGANLNLPSKHTLNGVVFYIVYVPTSSEYVAKWARKFKNQEEDEGEQRNSRRQVEKVFEYKKARNYEQNDILFDDRARKNETEYGCSIST